MAEVATRFFMPEEGLRFIADAYRAVGVGAEDAAKIAALMITADRRGADTHGIARLPIYVRRLKSGAINKAPNISIAQEAPATALVDGDNGMGHLVMQRAAEIAIAKARDCGVAWVGARRSNHAGAAAPYAMMGLKHDMIGLYLAVAEMNHMAPPGGIEPLLGTNPIAIAIPALEEAPIVHDIATTVASNGKVGAAVEAGERFPEGWMIDRQGNPITEPARAGDGVLLPIGGYKGFGLGLVFALMGGALNGAPVGHDAGSPETPPRKGPANTGQAVMMLDIARFAAPQEFKRRVDKFLREIRNSKPLPGRGPVRYPGQRGDALDREAATKGIGLRAAPFAALEKLAAELGIAKLAVF